MEEGRDLAVFDSASGPFGHLGLANLDWVIDAGRPALRFADNTTGRTDAFGAAARYLDEPTIGNASTRPPWPSPATTAAAWISPPSPLRVDQASRADGHAEKSARRRDRPRRAPRRPESRRPQATVPTDAPPRRQRDLQSEDGAQADRWYHVAATAEPTPEKKWKISLYLDGARVLEGLSEKSTPPFRLPPSLVCGAELFYLHEAYYRGLLGRVTVFDRALSEEEIKQLAAP